MRFHTGRNVRSPLFPGCDWRSNLPASPGTGAPMHKIEREPLAIVGIGCRFPGGATSPESLWQLLRTASTRSTKCRPTAGIIGASSTRTRRSPEERTPVMAGSWPGRRTTSTRRSSGSPLARPPSSIRSSGCCSRSAWEALEDAGHDIVALRRRPIGVFVGGFSLDNLIDRFGIVSRDHISPSSATAGTMVMLSNRLSHAFDFIGPACRSTRPARRRSSPPISPASRSGTAT